MPKLFMQHEYEVAEKAENFGMLLRMVKAAAIARECTEDITKDQFRLGFGFDRHPVPEIGALMVSAEPSEPVVDTQKLLDDALEAKRQYILKNEAGLTAEERQEKYPELFKGEGK